MIYSALLLCIYQQNFAIEGERKDEKNSCKFDKGFKLAKGNINGKKHSAAHSCNTRSNCYAIEYESSYA